VVSIYWQGEDPFPLKSWLKLTHSLLKAASFDNYQNLSTIKDEKSAAKFRYIKTVSGKVVALSIAFRVVSIYRQGVAPFP